MIPSDRQPEPVAGVRLTHPERLLWPDVGLTKQDLAAFYAAIAEWALPHLAGRPLLVVRCPAGVGQDCFVQKHAWAGMSSAIQRHAIGNEEVLVIQTFEGLIALVQASVLEIHPWGAWIEAPEQPDRVTIDLDPAENVAWSSVIEAAGEVRERLRQQGLESFVKTTGGKGLHVVVPLRPCAGWPAVKRFARALATAMAGDQPERYIAKSTIRERAGRIYIDYLRNSQGATAIGTYSPRARPRAPVSTPLSWQELSPAIRPSDFTVGSVLTRLREVGRDPWADMARVDQVLPAKPKARRRS